MFNSIDSIKDFNKVLIDEMSKLDEEELKNQLIHWSNESFTTSSEFLGEFKIILMEIAKIKGLDYAKRVNIEKCINEINKAFEYASKN